MRSLAIRLLGRALTCAHLWPGHESLPEGGRYLLRRGTDPEVSDEDFQEMCHAPTYGVSQGTSSEGPDVSCTKKVVLQAVLR